MYTFEWKNKSNQMCQLVLKETRSLAQHSLIQFLPPRCHGIPQFMEIERAHQTPMRVMSSQPAADNQQQCERHGPQANKTSGQDRFT